MSSAILYEHPLNERMRTLLRLEQLFAQLHHFQDGSSLWDSQASMTTLIEILGILERLDIRSEVLKELDRHIGGLSRLMDTPAVDHARLEDTLTELHEQFRQIQRLPNKLSSDMRENDLLNAIRQKMLLTGGTCGFDIPAYHYWLNQPAHVKGECLTRWIDEISPLNGAIELLLMLIRNSALFETHSAHLGLFQQSLDIQQPCQLLRVSLPADSTVYPEVSGNKHRINIRFLSFSELSKPKQVTTNLEFQMSCCAI